MGKFDIFAKKGIMKYSHKGFFVSRLSPLKSRDLKMGVSPWIRTGGLSHHNALSASVVGGHAKNLDTDERKLFRLGFVYRACTCTCACVEFPIKSQISGNTGR